MRKTKFRAWDKENNEMIQVYGAWFEEQGNYHETDFTLIAYRYVLMQYTGLKDKNGREIYEGDILGAKDRWFKPIVGFRDGMFVVKNLSPYCRLHEYMKDENWIIIGNKYENPELLKDKVTVSEV